MFTPSPDPPSSLLWWKCSAKGYLPLCILSGSKVGLWTPDVMIFFCSKWKISDKMTASNIKLGIVIWGFGKARNHDKFRCQSQQGRHNLNLRTNHCKASKKIQHDIRWCCCMFNTFQYIYISNRKFLRHRDIFWASARDEMPEGPQGEALVITKCGDVDCPGRMDLAVDIMISSNNWKILKDVPNINLKIWWGDQFLPFCVNAN